VLSFFFCCLKAQLHVDGNPVTSTENSGCEVERGITAAGTDRYSQSDNIGVTDNLFKTGLTGHDSVPEVENSIPADVFDQNSDDLFVANEQFNESEVEVVGYGSVPDSTTADGTGKNCLSHNTSIVDNLFETDVTGHNGVSGIETEVDETGQNTDNLIESMIVHNNEPAVKTGGHVSITDGAIADETRQSVDGLDLTTNEHKNGAGFEVSDNIEIVEASFKADGFGHIPLSTNAVYSDVASDTTVDDGLTSVVSDL
jgi:hypothetical protein